MIDKEIKTGRETELGTEEEKEEIEPAVEDSSEEYY